ncbi:glycosyltransferase family 4 protein [Luteirhabdus pelagi]|uniref:glycosyltransferase family 4 protein n=1 Tax=Luteirhabdus pelagi TaxID=2792783 RepID=UPI00193946ED|nr:glycosyltransferase family 4 protein [Luteirhabdus pelagi]
MKFAVITHVPHTLKEECIYAYAPYVREMNIWGRHVSSVLLVAPDSNSDVPSVIESPYTMKDIIWKKVPAFSFVTLGQAIRALFVIPLVFFRILKACRNADHIHLRCPGNIGLLGCIVQLFFPGKPKTVKYAGNWDPNAKQPLSYRLQKWILGNSFLTKNMNVLVYGEWPAQSKNILPFFTATYKEDKKEEIEEKNFFPPWRFLFVGTLSPGKRPMYALKLIEALYKKGIAVSLDVYGDGVKRNVLEQYSSANGLTDLVSFHGNQSAAMIEKAYKESHFLMLPSQSEGWPKVIAEAMFFGLVPIATPISCVPWMLDNENRGILLSLSLKTDTDRIAAVLKTPEDLRSKSLAAKEWSQYYTLNRFEKEIQKLL